MNADIEKGIIRDSEKYTAPRCALCNHPNREQIEEMILSGLHTQKSIAAQYNISEQSISNHKNLHMLSDVKANLRTLVFEKINKGRVKDSSIGDVIRALEYLEPSVQCEKCQYRLNVKPLRSLEQVLSEFLGMDGKYKDAPCWEYIHIIPDEYPAFADFVKDEKRDLQICVCPEAYKKFKEVKK